MASVANDHLFQFNFIPFGLKNSPSNFSRVMMTVLSPLIGHNVLVYLDNIIITGNTAEVHSNNIRKVLEALRHNVMKIYLSKCNFFHKQVKFLGHVITPEGIQPCPCKVKAIKEFPRPHTPEEVAGVFGLAGYYRKFIRDFGEIARPLDALKKQKVINLGVEDERAFNQLKAALTCDDLLTYPRFDRPFLVTTDASSVAIGGVISQRDDEGRERPVCFTSRALKGVKRIIVFQSSGFGHSLGSGGIGSFY